MIIINYNPDNHDVSWANVIMMIILCLWQLIILIIDTDNLPANAHDVSWANDHDHCDLDDHCDHGDQCEHVDHCDHDVNLIILIIVTLMICPKLSERVMELISISSRQGSVC